MQGLGNMNAYAALVGAQSAMQSTGYIQAAVKPPETMSSIIDDVGSHQARLMDALNRLRKVSDVLAGPVLRAVDNAPSTGFPQSPGLVDRLRNQRDAEAALLSEIDNEIRRIENAI